MEEKLGVYVLGLLFISQEDKAPSHAHRAQSYIYKYPRGEEGAVVW
jgi:hypothetical protein